ncbi:MAG: DMT family transporter, partial [Candidatus Aenigmarchaeota archaeon]|nr:DMT family transporter [Candidatus Aenigmarchaeota archaeon]
MKLDHEAKGTALAFAAAIISGFAIFANKIFVVDLDPLVFTAVRAMLVGALFFSLSIATHGFSQGRPNGKVWQYLLAIGIVGGGLAFYLFFSGLQLTTA